MAWWQGKGKRNVKARPWTDAEEEPRQGICPQNLSSLIASKLFPGEDGGAKPGSALALPQAAAGRDALVSAWECRVRKGLEQAAWIEMEQLTDLQALLPNERRVRVSGQISVCQGKPEFPGWEGAPHLCLISRAQMKEEKRGRDPSSSHSSPFVRIIFVFNAKRGLFSVSFLLCLLGGSTGTHSRKLTLKAFM